MHPIIFFKKQFRCVIFKFAKFFILPAICFNLIGQNRENRAILIGWRRLGIVSLLKDFSISSAFGKREWGVGADRMDAKNFPRNYEKRKKSNIHFSLLLFLRMSISKFLGSLSLSFYPSVSYSLFLAM